MSGRIGTRRLAACAAVGVLALAGCTGQPAPAPAPPAPSPAPATPKPPVFDPPKQFDQAGAVPLPKTVAAGVDKHAPPPVALHGTTAYLMTKSSLLVVDTRTGRQLAAIRPQHQPKSAFRGFGAVIATPPVITEVQGKSLALASFVVNVPGHGTTPGHRAVEVVAVDTATHKLAWRMTVPMRNADSYRDYFAQVVGVKGSTAIVSVAEPGTHSGAATVYAVHLPTRTVRWSHDKAQAVALAGGRVIGTVPAGTMSQRLTAWTVADGRKQWQTLSGQRMQVQAAGSSLLAVSGTSYDTGDPFFALVDAANGAPVDRSDGHGARARCTFDEVSVLVCSRGALSKTDQVFAIDVNTRKMLWQLPAAGRVPPTVTTA